MYVQIVMVHLFYERKFVWCDKVMEVWIMVGGDVILLNKKLNYNNSN